jgi:hypothetical protein
MIGTPDLCLVGLDFNSQPGGQLSCLRVFMIFVSPSRQILGKHHTIYHDLCLLRLSQYIIHTDPFIWHYVTYAVEKWYINRNVKNLNLTVGRWQVAPWMQAPRYMRIESTVCIQMFSKWQGVWLQDIARNTLVLAGEKREKTREVELREMMK